MGSGAEAGSGLVRSKSCAGGRERRLGAGRGGDQRWADVTGLAGRRSAVGHHDGADGPETGGSGMEDRLGPGGGRRR
jgi:hypothetical protein